MSHIRIPFFTATHAVGDGVSRTDPIGIEITPEIARQIVSLGQPTRQDKPARLRKLQADRDGPVQGPAEKPKPPLGLMPHHCWVYRRISEIMRAIIRYEDAGMPVPPEWCSELRGHLVASNPADDPAGGSKS